MNVEYKGYIITPNSRELPDGRWLPVAELEIYYRGSIKTKPPIVAKPKEARMIRAQADDAAIVMAKRWIDEKG